MPYTKIKLPGGGYEVRSPTHVHSHHTTAKKAAAQIRLLNAIEHNPDFKRKKK